MNILITENNKFVELSKVQEAHESYRKASLDIVSIKLQYIK